MLEHHAERWLPLVQIEREAHPEYGGCFQTGSETSVIAQLIGKKRNKMFIKFEDNTKLRGLSHTLENGIRMQNDLDQIEKLVLNRVHFDKDICRARKN